ncbi:hypothetical protein D4764_15G0012750 [Takifugu flavidus]|uniref:Uncharacterized protein n=1 Tax=Takifugu flavidus TaxID=433684 RepID=A0A5C6P4L5_9TELE|nr:hypothetical protein D4764_15G0012750 [Takifugu flavidus]
MSHVLQNVRFGKKNPSIHPSIHPSILYRLSGVGLRGQQPKKRSPDFPLPSYLFQLIRRDPQAFPGQSRDIVCPACPGLPGGLLPEGHALNTSPGRRPGGILTRCPSHPIWLLSTWRSSGSTPSSSRMAELLPLSKGEPSHPTEEAHFGRLYP